MARAQRLDQSAEAIVRVVGGDVHAGRGHAGLIVEHLLADEAQSIVRVGIDDSPLVGGLDQIARRVVLLDGGVGRARTILAGADHRQRRDFLLYLIGAAKERVAVAGGDRRGRVPRDGVAHLSRHGIDRVPVGIGVGCVGSGLGHHRGGALALLDLRIRQITLYRADGYVGGGVVITDFDSPEVLLRYWYRPVPLL